MLMDDDFDMSAQQFHRWMENACLFHPQSRRISPLLCLFFFWFVFTLQQPHNRQNVANQLCPIGRRSQGQQRLTTSSIPGLSPSRLVPVTVRYRPSESTCSCATGVLKKPSRDDASATAFFAIFRAPTNTPMITDRKETTSPTFGLGIFHRPHTRYIEIHCKEYYGVVGKAPVPSAIWTRQCR